jgi:hypothetical protein
MTGSAFQAAEVLDVFAAHCRYLVEGRADLLGDLLTDSFTAEHLTGHVASRVEWLGQIAAGEFVYHRITPEYTDVDVDVDGSRATVTSRAVYDVTIHGHRGRYRLATTRHYVRDRGAWTATRGTSTTY